MCQCPKTCIPFALAAGSDAWLLGLVGVVFWGLGNCIGTVTPAVVASQTYGQTHYGEVYGICLRFQTLGIASGVPAISMIATATGSFTLVWMICSVLAVMLLAFYAIGLRGSQAYRSRKNEEFTQPLPAAQAALITE